MVFSFLGILLLASAVSGQNPLPSGNLYGTTLDEQGRLLPGVMVTLRGPGAPQTARTDPTGEFHFLDLSPGIYSVTLERTGFAATRREEVLVSLGKNTILRVTMSLAATEEAVTVSGESALPDSRKTETSATFERKELDTIPTTRNLSSILRQVPGVLVTDMDVNGSLSGMLNAFIGKGSSLFQNTYTLDGVAITGPGGATPLRFDFDALQEIAVVTGGSDPSLATPGVAVNLVTKRGTNELKGSARAFHFFPSSVGSSDQASSKGGWDYGLEAGGPLWRDRLWLWAAGARNDVPAQTLFLFDGEPVRQKTDLRYWNAKLNVQLAPANSLTFSYTNSNNVVDGLGAGPDRSQASTWNRTVPTAAYRMEDSHVLSEKLFASVYFSYLTSEFTETPEGGLDKQADFDADSVWRNSYYFFRSRTRQPQVGATVSGFFNTGGLQHELKFGFGYKHVHVSSLTAWPGGGLIGNEPDSAAAVTRDADYAFEVNYYDAYLADTIRTGNFTINLGSRFDYQQGRNLPSASPASPVFPDLLPAVKYSGDSGYPITWRLLQPRLGVTYALGQHRKTLFRASYSRFANQLLSEVSLVNAFGGSPAYLFYAWNDSNGDHRVEPNELDLSQFRGASNVDPANPGLSVPVNRIAQNLKPPVTDEFIVGAERQILSDLSASIAYTHRSFRNLVRTPGYARIVGVTIADYRYLGSAVGSVTGSNGFTLNFNEPYYGLATCPAPCAGIEVGNRPDYSQTYNGLELQILKRLSHGWMLRAGFAYNDWTQDVGRGAIFNPNNIVGGLNVSGAVVQGTSNRFTGFALINSKWQFNVSGMVQLPLGIEAAANLFGRQGFVQPYFIRVVTHDTNNSRLLLQIGKVDAYRLPDVYQLDLHLEKPLRIGPHLTIIPSVDCFNVPNSHTVLQRDGFVGKWNHGVAQPFTPWDGFNSVAERLSDRTFRTGVRISF